MQFKRNILDFILAIVTFLLFFVSCGMWFRFSDEVPEFFLESTSTLLLLSIKITIDLARYLDTVFDGLIAARQ